MAVPPVHLRVLSQRSFSPLYQSPLSTNDKDDYGMVPGGVLISGIYVRTEESPGKIQLGNSLMTAVRPNHRIKCGNLPPNDLC